MADLIDELTDLVVLYDAKLNDRQLDIYLEALSDISPEDLHLAIVLLTRTSKWMPKISEIRQAVDDARAKVDAADAENWHARRNALANTPWTTVEKWDRQGRKTVYPVVEPLALDTCVTCGAQYAGWPECPDCTLEVNK